MHQRSFFSALPSIFQFYRGMLFWFFRLLRRFFFVRLGQFASVGRVIYDVLRPFFVRRRLFVGFFSQTGSYRGSVSVLVQLIAEGGGRILYRVRGLSQLSRVRGGGFSAFNVNTHLRCRECHFQGYRGVPRSVQVYGHSQASALGLFFRRQGRASIATGRVSGARNCRVYL